MEDTELSKKQIFFSILALFIICIGFFSFTIIGAGERGVVYSKSSGVQDYVLLEGFHLKIPFIHSVEKFDVRTNKFELTTTSTSNDQQIVQATVVLNYHLNPETVNKLYQEVGRDYLNRIIKPAIESSLKTSMAKFNAAELIQQRDAVMFEIKTNVENKLSLNEIVVDGVNLINIDFSDEYDKAIERKVTAEQEALTAKNALERIKIEKQQRIVQAEAEKESRILEAEGEAEAIKIKQEALQQSSEVLDYKWIETWDGKLPTYYGGNENLLLSINQS